MRDKAKKGAKTEKRGKKQTMKTNATKLREPHKYKSKPLPTAYHKTTK